MGVRWDSVCIDAEDPEAQGRWWSEVLGWPVEVDDDGDVVVEAAVGSPERDRAPAILFLAVPGRKQVKNRLHLDLRPDDQAAEVARLEGMGARRVDVGQPDDVTWAVLADPEGNEFCVLRALRPDEADAG